MLIKTISYEDLNGRTRTEEHYFNFSKSELAKQQIIHSTVDDDPDKNAYMAYIEREISSGNGKRIMNVFEEIIFLSYGLKDEDGKTFLKSEEISKRFSQTGAYDQFFLNLVTDAEYAQEFFNGIMPPDLVSQANNIRNQPGYHAGMSESEIARLASEARMQGHKPTQSAPQQPSFPEYPTSIQTPPVFQDAPNEYEGYPQPPVARQTFTEEAEPAKHVLTQEGTGAQVTVDDSDYQEFLEAKRRRLAAQEGMGDQQ